MTRALLIGGAGFIGRHVASNCLMAGMDVRIADVYEPMTALLAADGLPAGVDLRIGNYDDAQFLRSVLADVDVVIHLAHDAMRLNVECDMPQEYERNILPATRLMEACIEARIAKFLFVSSGGTVYGNQPVDSPILESAGTRPVSLYGTSKLCIEHIALLYFVQRDLPAIIVRPGNAYGPGQHPFRGQGLIPTALASGLTDREVTIYGDGHAVRDYVHVLDIATAITHLVGHGRPGDTYNVGTGIGISVRRLLEDHISPLLAADGVGLDVRYHPSRRADVEYNVLDSSKLASLTGWAPSIALGDGIAEVLRWLRSQRKFA